MTPGLKVQYRQEEDPETGEPVMVGEEYDFNEQNLVQCVRNFERTFSERRLVMDDGNHRAADPGHSQPQELARYSGEAAIWNGKVVAFWDHYPDLPPPDPAQLLAALQQKFPRATSVDGLWGYRREVTPLGRERLPNLHQTSPQFSKDDTDEYGNSIGYNVNVISPVYTAHQNGTVLMSKVTMAQPSSGLHAPRPLGESMPDEKEKKAPEGEENKFGAEMRQKICAKFGLPEGASDEAIMTAMYVGGKFADEPEPAKDPTDKPDGEMGDDLPGPDGLGKMGKTVIAALQKRVTDAESLAAQNATELAALKAERQKVARATFAKVMVQGDGEEPARFRTEQDALSFLDEHGGDTQKAATFAKKYLPPVGLMSRLTQGGHPVGTATLQHGDKSVEFSKLTDDAYANDPEIRAIPNHNARYAAAMSKVVRQRPDLYR